MTPIVNLLASAGKTEELRRAVASGSSLGSVDEFGLTPLHNAIVWHHEQTALTLVELGAEIAAQDREGKTPLHYAIEHSQGVVAAAMVVRSPSVLSVADAYGNEPLWTAVFNSAKAGPELVQLMLRSGANPLHRNRARRSPADLAGVRGPEWLRSMFEASEKRSSVGMRGVA